MKLRAAIKNDAGSQPCEGAITSAGRINLSMTVAWRLATAIMLRSGTVIFDASEEARRRVPKPNASQDGCCGCHGRYAQAETVKRGIGRSCCEPGPQYFGWTARHLNQT